MKLYKFEYTVPSNSLSDRDMNANNFVPNDIFISASRGGSTDEVHWIRDGNNGNTHTFVTCTALSRDIINEAADSAANIIHQNIVYLLQEYEPSVGTPNINYKFNES